ncbi:LarC family nickel insertion protein [Brachybacterium sp. P6-10-X1]|uniref:LarC family nickel insertion protein n=1 Tax=Brachybacterium sp. P6-10-X1 TaxID=1903186 RepID=UPI00210FF563|nr:LarC family nickel insertion protein [Brachybacterium sp. P6-10-X1]
MVPTPIPVPPAEHMTSLEATAPPGHALGRLAYVDATAGVAGDMLLGALVDAGADLDGVQRVLDALVPGSVRFVRRGVDRAGQRATKVDVEVLVEDPPHRTWASIRAMLERARASEEVPARTIDLALAVFSRLAEAEGATHGVPPDQVHFHEVGALDSLADVIGACEAWRRLGITAGVGSVIAVGSGRIRAAHGDIPVPVPAVARLAQGWPTVAGELLPPRGHDPAHHHAHPHGEGDRPPHEDHGPDATHAPHHGTDPASGDLAVPDSDVAVPEHVAGGPHEHGGRRVPPGVAPGIGELATPTGVALMRGLVGFAGPQPMLSTEAVGIGAGTKDTPGRPNVVRVVVGRPGYGEADLAGSHQGDSTEHRTEHRAEHPVGTTSAAPSALAASELPTGPAAAAASSGTAADAHDTPTSALQLEANVDDLDPRLWPGVLEELFAHGALDAWLTPITMKHGRPAVTVHALVREESAGSTAALLMDRTGTLGVRMHRVERVIRTREFTEIEVRGQKVAVKIARDRDGAVVRREPEFRDVAAAARVLGISERAMLDLAKESTTELTDPRP